MPKLESKIEAILLFKNEPVSLGELSAWLKVDRETVKKSLSNLKEFYKERGLVIVSDGEKFGLGTHPDMGKLIEGLVKEELSRELGRAGLETLALVLYRGPISRREIDHVRGVNSSFILRTLLIRGLIERTEKSNAEPADRSYSYKPTLKLLEYLGVRESEELPEFQTAFENVEKFVKSTESKVAEDE